MKLNAEKPSKPSSIIETFLGTWFLSSLCLEEVTMGEIVWSMAERKMVRTIKQIVFQMLSTFSVKFPSNITPTSLVSLYHYLTHIH